MGEGGQVVLSTGVAVKTWGWWPGSVFGSGGLVFYFLVVLFLRMEKDGIS